MTLVIKFNVDELMEDKYVAVELHSVSDVTILLTLITTFHTLLLLKNPMEVILIGHAASLQDLVLNAYAFNSMIQPKKLSFVVVAHMNLLHNLDSMREITKFFILKTL